MSETNEIPVCVWKKDPKQSGQGNYSMVACFRERHVHVPFTFTTYFADSSYMERLETVGTPVACDGSCTNQLASPEDFGEVRDADLHEVQPIIDAARSFAH
jgi:hypothetical protein